MKKIFLLTIILCSSLTIFSQRGIEVGGWLGGAFYFGDLNTSYRLSKPGQAGGLIARYVPNNRMAYRFSANYGLIQADDKDSDNVFEKARNLSFKSNLFEATFQYEFNFLPYIHGSPDHYFTPYLLAGISAFHFDPKAKIDGQYERLRPLGTEGQDQGQEYSPFQVALAYGFGVKFDLSYEWSVNVELSARRLFTDYLDDVSTAYPDLATLAVQRGDLAARLSDRSGEINEIAIGQLDRQRGNKEDKDSFNFLSIGLVYYIGFLECPPLSKPQF